MAVTLTDDDFDAIADRVVAKLQALVAAAQRPAPGVRPTLEQCLVAPAYEAYGEIDLDRSSGQANVSLPGTGLSPVAFQLDDTDLGKYRHRLS